MTFRQNITNSCLVTKSITTAQYNEGQVCESVARVNPCTAFCLRMALFHTVLDWSYINTACTHMLRECDCVNEALLSEGVSHFSDALGELNSIRSKFRWLQFMVSDMRTSCNTLWDVCRAGEDESTGNLFPLPVVFLINCWTVNLQRLHVMQQGDLGELQHSLGQDQ